MKNKILLITIAIATIAISAIAQTTGTLIDSRDDKSYNTIKIGNQWWMAENLAYKTSSGCWAYNNDLSNVTKYGYLYNWEMAKSVCPIGWHLPSHLEWNALIELCENKCRKYGNLLKSKSSWNGSDYFGFNALPSGCRMSNGVFDSKSYNAFWWSSSEEQNKKKAWYQYLFNDTTAFNIGVLSDSIACGFSVRCICDNSNTYESLESKQKIIENENKKGINLPSYGKFKEYYIGVSTTSSISYDYCSTTTFYISDFTTNEYKSLGNEFTLSNCKGSILNLTGIDFSVDYYFYKSILFEVDLIGNSSSIESLNQLITVFITKYGEPTSSDKTNGGTYIWANDTNYLSLVISTNYNAKIKYWSKSLMTTIYNNFIESIGKSINNESKKF